MVICKSFKCKFYRHIYNLFIINTWIKYLLEHVSKIVNLI